MIDPARFAEVAEATRRAPTNEEVSGIADLARQQQQHVYYPVDVNLNRKAGQ